MFTQQAVDCVPPMSDHEALEKLREVYYEHVLSSFPVCGILKLGCAVEIEGVESEVYKECMKKAIQEQVFQQYIDTLRNGVDLIINRKKAFVKMDFVRVGAGFYYTRSTYHELVKTAVTKKLQEHINKVWEKRLADGALADQVNTGTGSERVKSVHFTFLLSQPMEYLDLKVV